MAQELPFQCDHEEADSKMFVYLHHYSLERDLTNIVVESPDTDVSVISCYQFALKFHHVKEFWFKTGTAQQKRYIPVHQLVDNLVTTLNKMLPAFHSITGYDSTSSFCGLRKKNCLDDSQEIF